MSKKDIDLTTHTFKFIHNKKHIALMQDNVRIFYYPIAGQKQERPSRYRHKNLSPQITVSPFKERIAHAIIFLKYYTGGEIKTFDDLMSNTFEILTNPVIVNFQRTGTYTTKERALNPIDLKGTGPKANVQFQIPNIIVSLENNDIIVTVSEKQLFEIGPISKAWTILTKLKSNLGNRSNESMYQKLINLSETDLIQEQLRNRESATWRFKSLVDFYERLHQKKLW